MNNGKIKPFPYQKEGVRQIEDFDGRVLLADEMGLGKTLQTLWALKRNPSWMPALVVCPASVKYNWEYEATHNIGIRPSICEGQTPPKFFNNVWARPTITIINYDILRFWAPYLERVGFNTIVFDEGQYLQNPRSKRTRASMFLARDMPHVLVLSGTPLTNKPAELWPSLNILWPDHYKSFWSFAQDFCSPKLTQWGWDFSGASNLKELRRQLLLRGMIRRRKKDVLADLPEKIRRIEPCELSNPKQYKQATDDFLGWIRQYKSHKIRKVVKAQALVKVGYLLELVAKLKIRSVVNWANRFLDETNEKLIIFAVHKKAIKVLAKRINAKHVIVDGSVTGRKRRMAVEQFQKDKKTRLFIGNIKAAGIGITLTAASTVGFAEMYWHPGVHIQAEDRLHRIGQTKPVWIHYFVAGGTIEERLCKMLQKKQEVISAVLDGGPMTTDLNIYEELVRELEKE